jgi:hypothetical protein
MSKLHKIILVIVLLTLVLVATGCDPDGDGTNALQDLKEDMGKLKALGNAGKCLNNGLHGSAEDCPQAGQQ